MIDKERFVNDTMNGKGIFRTIKDEYRKKRDETRKAWREKPEKKILEIGETIQTFAWNIGKYFSSVGIFVYGLLPRVGFEKTVIFILLVMMVKIIGMKK